MRVCQHNERRKSTAHTLAACSNQGSNTHHTFTRWQAIQRRTVAKVELVLVGRMPALNPGKGTKVIMELANTVA